MVLGPRSRAARIVPGFVVSLHLLGCINPDIPPAGSYSEVLLITDTGARDPFAERLTPYLTRPVNYFVGEDVPFEVHQAPAAAADDVPRFKNIVFCGVANPTTGVGRRISSLLGGAGVQRVRIGETHVFRKDDLPGPGQVTMIVTAQSPEELWEVIDDRGAEITATLETSCRERIRENLLDNGNADLTRELERKYGFSIQIPIFYALQSDAADPPGIELLRPDPPRSLGVFWVDWKTPPTVQDRQALFNVRARYVFQRYDGDAMDSTRVTLVSDRLGDFEAIRMDGYWTSTRSVAGGAYTTYFVFEESERVLWAIDLLVYAPGLPKHRFFRELLAVAETFRY
jgi:hypothetical protein